MDIFGILDPDPHENLCGSETLILRRVSRQGSIVIIYNFNAHLSALALLHQSDKHLKKYPQTLGRFKEMPLFATCTIKSCHFVRGYK